MPGNFDEPSHTVRRDLAAEERYAAHTAGVAVPDSHDPAAAEISHKNSRYSALAPIVPIGITLRW